MVKELLQRDKEATDLAPTQSLMALGVLEKHGYREVPNEVLVGLCELVGVGGEFYSYQPYFSGRLGKTALYCGQITGSERHGVVHPGDLRVLESQGLLNIDERKGSISLTNEGRNYVQKMSSEHAEEKQKIEGVIKDVEGPTQKDTFARILNVAYVSRVLRVSADPKSAF